MNREFTMKEKYTLNSDYELRELGGEFVVIKKGEEHADPSRVVFFNERCIFLWRKLEEGATLKEMMESLMIKFDIDDEESEADVGEFIGKLKHTGMAY